MQSSYLPQAEFPGVWAESSMPRRLCRPRRAITEPWAPPPPAHASTTAGQHHHPPRDFDDTHCMNIILMGYRGSGKTSIGKKIASQTWKDFIDTDVEIVKRFNHRTIADIWATDGEPAFRAVEIQVTREVLQRDDHVIALGGGTVMQDGLADAIKAAPDAIRIYLACKPAVLAQRIADDASSSASRPSLTQSTVTTAPGNKPLDDNCPAGEADGSNIGGGSLAEITAILNQRDPVYRDLADVTFDVSYLEIDAAVAYLTSHHL